MMKNQSINMQEKPSIRNDLLSDQGGANELTDIPDGVQKKSFVRLIMAHRRALF